jgi:hypothetical protein
MAQQYKPGDWYEQSSGTIMLYQGSSWKNVGQRGSPGGQDAIQGRNVAPPGAAVNPYVAEEAAAVRANTNTSTPLDRSVKTVLNIPPPKTDSSTLRYPSDIDGTTDYVVFSFFGYAPPFGGGENTPNEAKTSSSGTGGYANYQDSNDRSYSNPSKKVKPIILYMPEDIQSQFGAGWNGAGFGAAAAGMLGTVGSMQSQKNGMAQLQAFGGTASGIVKTAAFSTLISGINTAAGANISLNQGLGTISGTIINPNVELAYEAPKLRTFTLRFKMTPRSGPDSTNIQKICNSFKKAMLPSFGGQSLFGSIQNAANLLTIPDLCQVSFMKGGSIHPYLPRYKLCGITDVNINYAAAGAYASFGDGAPVATELTVSFLESKLIFEEEVTIEGGGI